MMPIIYLGPVDRPYPGKRAPESKPERGGRPPPSKALRQLTGKRRPAKSLSEIKEENRLAVEFHRPHNKEDRP